MGKDLGIGRVQELTYELKVEEVMTRDVIAVRPDSRVKELRELLRDKKISGALLWMGSAWSELSALRIS